MNTSFEQYLALKKTQSTHSVPQATPSMDTLSVPPETLERIFQECLADLNRRTLQGLFGEANPAMLAQVNEAQARVDKTWQECLQGKASLESFKEAVARWYEAVVSLFSNTSPQAQGQRVEQGRLL